MRKYLALATAAMLLLVGCTSGSDKSASTTTAGSGSSVADSRAPGVTADTIKVGITYIDFEPIKDLTKIRHGDYPGSYKALIDDLNAKGGIAGRKIEPVFAPVSPIGTDSADAACVKLTQDEKVFVVMGYFQADTVLCPVEAHATAVLGGTMTAERLARAKAPWFTTDVGGDSDQDAIRALAEKGELDGKLGVAATIQGEASLHKDAEPLLAKLGIEPVDVAVIDAPENDVAAQNSAVQVIAERFRSKGIKKVLLYGQAGLTWSNGAAALDYRPELRFTGLDAILAYSNDQTKDVGLLQGAVVAAKYDGPTDHFHPSLKPCFDVIEKATGVKLHTKAESDKAGEPYDFIAPSSACGNLALLKAILEKAGKKLDYGTFRKAGESLGTIRIPPGGLTEYHFGPPPHADGDPALDMFDWDPKTREFVRR
jgi:hypothetical protein